MRRGVILGAALVAFGAIVLSPRIEPQPHDGLTVWAASHDLPAHRVIEEGDVHPVEIPRHLATDREFIAPPLGRKPFERVLAGEVIRAERLEDHTHAQHVLVGLRAPADADVAIGQVVDVWQDTERLAADAIIVDHDPGTTWWEIAVPPDAAAMGSPEGPVRFVPFDPSTTLDAGPRVGRVSRDPLVHGLAADCIPLQLTALGEPSARFFHPDGMPCGPPISR